MSTTAEHALTTVHWFDDLVKRPETKLTRWHLHHVGRWDRLGAMGGCVSGGVTTPGAHITAVLTATKRVTLFLTTGTICDGFRMVRAPAYASSPRRKCCKLFLPEVLR
jgi:hypothetical protein